MASVPFGCLASLCVCSSPRERTASFRGRFRAKNATSCAEVPRYSVVLSLGQRGSGAVGQLTMCCDAASGGRVGVHARRQHGGPGQRATRHRPRLGVEKCVREGAHDHMPSARMGSPIVYSGFLASSAFTRRYRSLEDHLPCSRFPSLLVCGWQSKSSCG